MVTREFSGTLTETKSDFDFDAEKGASILFAFSLPVRQKALRLMAEREWDVSSLADALGISHASMSQHLSIFRRLKIVTTRRDRQWIYYSAPSNEVRVMIELIDFLER